MKRYIKASHAFIDELNDLLNEVGVEGFGETLSTISIPKLVSELGSKYEWLYDSYDEDPAYRDMLAIGDFIIQNYGDFIRKIAAERGDILSSDREVAALGYALETLI